MSVPFTYALQRDVIVATGKDTRSFLHSQLSNDIAALGAIQHPRTQSGEEALDIDIAIGGRLLMRFAKEFFYCGA
jgi:folate-binding Fe-S cluster repair protein YgfZ